MFKFLKKIFNDRSETDVGFYPSFHSFPNLGPDGEVTIDCVIRPSARASVENSLMDEKPYDWRTGVPAKRVGALVVEVDEYGLRFRWQTGEQGDDVFCFPALSVPRMKPAADPAENGSHESDVKPLKNAGVGVHVGEVPNVELRGEAKAQLLRSPA